MSKLIFCIIVLTLFFSKTLLSENNLIQNQNCSWDNKDNIPCLEIKIQIPNSSKFSEKGIKKTVISRKKIVESGATDLIDVLKNVPNIHVTQSGPKGQQASLFLRGTGSNHTLVLINGVAINDQSTTQGLHDFGVDFIQTIQQVEIFQGPNVTNFGANAIGGAINIITTGDYQDSFSLTTYNSNNFDFILNKSYLLQNDSSLNFKIGGVNSKTNSAKYNGKEDDELKNLSGNLNYEKWISKNIKLKGSTYLRQTIAEYDGSSTDELEYKGDNKMLTSQFGLTKTTKDTEEDLVIYYNNYDREYNEKNIIDYYNSEAFGVKYDKSGFILNNLSYGYGSNYRYDWGEFDNNGSSNSSTKGNYDNLSLYGNIGWNFFDDTSLSFFLRNDDNKVTGKHNSYKVNLEKQFGNVNLGITRMTGLRNPTLYELFGSASWGFAGNKFLNPEKSVTNQIYGDLKVNDNLIINLTGFQTSIFDHVEYINNTYVNNPTFTDLNQSGINNEIKFFNKNNSITFFSSFLSKKKKDGSDQLRRPEKSYGINLNKKFENSYLGNFQLNLNYKHYGEHFDTHSANFSTIKMDSTDLINLNLSKNYKNFQIFFNSTNIFDEGYQRPHGYSQDGRAFKIGMKKNF